MAVKQLFQTLADLIKQHQHLNQLAKDKMQAIKTEDLDTLTQLTKQENQTMQALRRTESERLKAITSLVMERKADLVPAEATLEDLKPLIPAEHVEVLDTFQDKLVRELNALQQQNELNQQMLKDSLQFVHMSLDLIQPSPDDDINYSAPHEREAMPAEGYSMFDSKA
ncbi:flagellar protein FlgN [Salsuginibacillus kocurii]|uniref:flagellar protein FlgN n=1 Tax=Salsuginibacillus kocurii TaxID=427078 RepID=UPI000362256D|nr:flagellar protein FlgN [Salsuginibacillus kocurii]